MSLHFLQNFFKQTITQPWATGTGNFYVSVKPVPTSGWLVISPSSTTLREIIYYTGVGSDATGDYITISTGGRGLGGTTEQTHDIGEPIRMNYTAEHQDEISDALDQIVAGGAQDASTATKGISKLSVTPVSGTNPIAVGDNDPRVLARPASIKFGGTGADGSLVISSGVTTIDCAGAMVVIKNYTSIAITGTGKLAFSNPNANGTTIVLRSQGNVTLSSSNVPNIDLTGMGANGSTGDSVYNQNATVYIGYGLYSSGGAAYTKVNGSGARDGNNGKNSSIYGSLRFSRMPMPGGGGSGGTTYTWSGTGGYGGTGGQGGGALMIEVGGSLTFTGTIWSKGSIGTGSADNKGGTGANGSVEILYNALTSNSGTIVVTGTGEDGLSLVALNTEFA